MEDRHAPASKALILIVKALIIFQGDRIFHLHHSLAANNSLLEISADQRLLVFRLSSVDGKPPFHRNKASGMSCFTVSCEFS